MKVKDIINEISTTYICTIEIYSDLIAQRTIRNDTAGATQYQKMLRGYLTCMRDAGMIGGAAFDSLFLWYSCDRVQKMIREGVVR
jgi:hypothetical protein